MWNLFYLFSFSPIFTDKIKETRRDTDKKRERPDIQRQKRLAMVYMGSNDQMKNTAYS